MTQENHDSNAVGWIQETIDQTATSIEGIHKSIAELPLDVMRRSGVLTRSADDISDVQNRSITVVYDVVRDVNQRVMGLVSDLLEADLESRN